MKEHGGFEGNAQTLRILAKLEKRETNCRHPTGIDEFGRDLRCGLNLSARVLASVLKYDNEIPLERTQLDALQKGYYQSERDVVDWLKHHVAGRAAFTPKFKTVECQIMDVADDIAYSTYDQEDALKAKIFLPLDATAPSADDSSRSPITPKVTSRALLRRLDEIFRDEMHDQFRERQLCQLRFPKGGQHVPANFLHRLGRKAG
jgi:dGTPase